MQERKKYFQNFNGKSTWNATEKEVGG